MKTVLVIFSLLICMAGFSQKRDYLVKNNGDTIWGDIKLQNKIFYVKNSGSLEVSAHEVSKVRIGKYKGSVVLPCNLQLYADNLADLELDYIKKSTADTVLILDEIYSTPKMNLYYAVDNFKIPFYFYKTPADQKPVQLVIRYYLQGGLGNYNDDRARYRGDKSKVSIAEDKGYVNQLHAIMGDCKKIPDAMWELLSYRDYSFKQLIKKYNKCN
ncbi:MAG: hypothetical protein ACKOU7_02895 [Ferruginibacter sp.]